MKMNQKLKKHSLKFISVFLSLFLWIYVLNSEKVKFEKTVSLEYILPEDMMFAERPQQEVIFMIEGPRAFVRTVAERDDKLIIDLNRASPKKLASFNVDIIPTQLKLPFGMIVERVLPRKIPIKLEKKASKLVPIKAQFMGKLPDQMSLNKAEIRPAEVEVYGPRSVITKLKDVSTKPIDLETLVGLSEVNVEPLFSDERLSLAPGTNLKLTYELSARSANLILKNIPVRFLAQHQKILGPPKTAVVRLLVPEKIKNRSNISSSVQVWADIPPGAIGKLEVPLRAIVPAGVHLLEIRPKTIVVNVQ